MAIAIEKGRITASIRNRPLGAVLEELSSRTGVALIPSADMDVEALRVSAELAGVPVDEGLRLCSRTTTRSSITASLAPVVVLASGLDLSGCGANLATGSARTLGGYQGTAGEPR